MLPLLAGSLWLVVVDTYVVTYASQGEHAPEGDQAMAAKTIARGLPQHTTALMSLSGVVGTRRACAMDNPVSKYLSGNLPQSWNSKFAISWQTILW